MLSRRTFAGLLAMSVLVIACGPFVGKAVDVQRDGTKVRLAVEGHNDPSTQAWLCPTDPGPGETWGDAGRARLEKAGCLDLGVSGANPDPSKGWSTVVDVTTLPADRVAAFASGAAAKYRLLLVRGDGLSVGTFSADVQAFDLRP